MFIQTLRPPVAGETFRFNIAGCAGATNVEVCANSKPILKREYNDLLCKSMVEIPNDCAGMTLSIRATDSAGHTKSLDYEISESDPGAHSMLSGTRAVPGKGYSREKPVSMMNRGNFQRY
jgi:hypothetical protein